jgi:hypothetical protein
MAGRLRTLALKTNDGRTRQYFGVFSVQGLCMIWNISIFLRPGGPTNQPPTGMHGTRLAPVTNRDATGEHR